MDLKKKIELKSGSLELHPDGYIKGIMADYAEISLEEAINRENAFIELCFGIPRPFIFDTRSKLIDYTEEAREYMANSQKMKAIRIADAFLVDNIGVRLFVKDYIRKNPSKCPSQVFSNEENAINWIKKFL